MALLPSDPAQQKRLLIGLAPILALFAYWYFFHPAKKEEVTAMRTHLEELETKNQAAIAQARRGGPDLEQRVALYEQYMERLERLIPALEEVPQLLHSVQQQANANSVELVLMRPQEDIQEAYYTRRTYQMAVSGAYRNIASYLTAIGSLPRIVAPIDVQIRPVTARGARPGHDTAPRVEAQFQIQTFVIPPDEVAAAPTPGGPNAEG